VPHQEPYTDTKTYVVKDDGPEVENVTEDVQKKDYISILGSKISQLKSEETGINNKAVIEQVEQSMQSDSELENFVILANSLEYVQRLESAHSEMNTEKCLLLQKIISASNTTDSECLVVLDRIINSIDRTISSDNYMELIQKLYKLEKINAYDDSFDRQILVGQLNDIADRIERNEGVKNFLY
jgi:hypothetical protein